MGFYLDNCEPFLMYQEIVKNPYFVDKTAMLQEIIPRIGITEKYICVTRPRRFGKSVAASMLGAFFSRACDSTEIFDRLDISRFPLYREYINQYHVIYIDFSTVGSFDTYSQFISEIQTVLKGDLRREYPDLSFRDKASVFEDLKWINLREVDILFERYQKSRRGGRITRQGLKEWYDGYHTYSGERLYNPRSVVAALTNDNLGNYWTSSGPYDELYFYIRNHVDDVRESLALMVVGEAVPARIKEYAATSMRLTTKDEIFSAMVVYGFLSYEDGKVSIPNQELMGKFEEMLRKEKTLGYVYRLAKESDRMLEATLAGNVEVMEEILAYAHNTETPLLAYNHETELTAVVNLVYLSARDSYDIQREDKAGTGYVDFIFYPKYGRKLDGIILELKVDSTPEEAIRQIKDKQYDLRFRGKLGERNFYSGRILAVGISYDARTKEHRCRIEVL